MVSTTHIATLISDIQNLIVRKDGWFHEELATSLSRDISLRLQSQLGANQQRSPLRLSKMGERCPRALWYEAHHPELAEALPPWAEVKYTFGHVIEALAIALAKAAGHRVEGEQDAVVLDGVPGHRDCVLDGCVVDVKSASSRSYLKFKTGSIREDDSFGYLDQLDGYVVASLEDPLVTVKDKGYLWAIDKQKGHMCLYEHYIRSDRIRERVREAKRIVGLSNPPDCTCSVITDGEQGNLRLDVRASYSAQKYCCFPNLRTFLYADGPRYFTKVVKRPTNKLGPIIEVDRYGKVVYN